MIKAIIPMDKLPNRCFDCPYLNDNYDYPRCEITNIVKGYNYNTRGGRMKECPLYEEKIQKYKVKFNFDEVYDE